MVRADDRVKGAVDHRSHRLRRGEVELELHSSAASNAPEAREQMLDELEAGGVYMKMDRNGQPSALSLRS
jgi:hypothetical protein